MLRPSTECLIAQLGHLWSLRRLISALDIGSVLEIADRLGAHLDSIRLATEDHRRIRSASTVARDHCLRYVLRCNQGERSSELRTAALLGIQDLEDTILGYLAVLAPEAPSERQDPAPRAESLAISATFGHGIVATASPPLAA